MTELKRPTDYSAIQPLLDWIIQATEPRPISEYHEDMGNVLWWRFPITEPPYAGTPNDLGAPIAIETHVMMPNAGGTGCDIILTGRTHTGGWIDDYYTHFTPIPVPQVPK